MFNMKMYICNKPYGVMVSETSIVVSKLEMLMFEHPFFGTHKWTPMRIHLRDLEEPESVNEWKT